MLGPADVKDRVENQMWAVHGLTEATSSVEHMGKLITMLKTLMTIAT